MEGASTQQKQLKSCCDIMRESGLADRRLHSESPVGRPHDHCLHRMRSSCPNLREPKRVHRILRSFENKDALVLRPQIWKLKIGCRIFYLTYLSLTTALTRSYSPPGRHGALGRPHKTPDACLSGTAARARDLPPGTEAARRGRQPVTNLGLELGDLKV